MRVASSAPAPVVAMECVRYSADMSDDHESMVSSAASGDEPAIESLLGRHMPALRAYVRLQAGEKIRRNESCSDLAQSVCREVLENIDDFEYQGEAAFKHWLFKRAMHKIQNRARYYDADKRNAAREANDESYSRCYQDIVTPSRVAMGREALAGVEEVFEQLSEEHRQVIVLSKIVGLTHAQIGEDMGRSEEASRMLLNRALVRLTGLVHKRFGSLPGK